MIYLQFKVHKYCAGSLAVLACLVHGIGSSAADSPSRTPNIIVILADDLGYGELGCYGATAVKTPNCDRVAHEGLRFTDGHCTHATCTPSRYSLLTGEYAWRKKGTGILPGDASLIIAPGRTTLPSMLKGAGYRTGVVGKWHLGLGEKSIDWNGDIKPGPMEIGFDYCFIMPATGDRVPCVYVENHRVVGLDPNDPISVGYGKKVGDDPTGKDHPELLKVHPSQGHDQTIVNGISRIGTMSGGKSARWVDEDRADVLTQKAVGFIEKNQDKPFFLYFATHDIHVPRVPHPRFVGQTTMGPRGDAIVEFDWSVGEILATLDRLKIADNTLLVVTSDNGPVLDDGYKEGAVEKLGSHKPAGPLRGGKGSTFEGGTREPFLVRWPGRVKPGVSDALVCQIDFLAAFATLTGQKLDGNSAPDSLDILPAVLGDARGADAGRASLTEESNGLRVGRWKLIEGKPKKGGGEKESQLFNLADDLGETKNLAAQNPDKVAEMEALLKKIRESGRSK